MPAQGPGVIPGEGAVAPKWTVGGAAALETGPRAGSSQTSASVCALNRGGGRSGGVLSGV